MSGFPKHIIGVSLIIVVGVAVGNLIAHQEDAQTEQERIIKPLIEKDISGLTKVLSILDSKRDKVWYEGDKLHFELMLEGAKQELRGNYKAAIESYLKALKVPL